MGLGTTCKGPRGNLLTYIPRKALGSQLGPDSCPSEGPPVGQQPQKGPSQSLAVLVPSQGRAFLAAEFPKPPRRLQQAEEQPWVALWAGVSFPTGFWPPHRS